ncbi:MULTISPECIES: NrtR DNA-binding winged helix domain-containing protein [unclassified Siphonobacter]|uniref:NUDIX hydrolase n=1 Tax=unclassified Siphonobacter TaxID=2635712 RepID=UPI002784A6B8|nr:MULTISPECIES: NUDIX domain-containing protein [unclassified Siphonobacter]MDQ1089106.1 8-oxo-dGTP diphosphatase [Siphonobacter sp. SORGH_AS_1065]MDR6195283.1 8-oxo-dGTP diphosphatase [Siphonobacter sp. SORGH_AS_0500]
MSLENPYIPQLSLDCVIFGFHASQLKVLVLRFKNSDFFALPGGFIRQDEDLNEAAQRVLMERTGLTEVYLEQFYTFGQRERGEVKMQREWAEANKRDVPEWLEKRFISVGFYALVDFSKVVLTTDEISDSCDWIDINELPSLMMDHSLMVKKALETLRLQLDQKWLVFNLLPEIFTIAELQKAYETILGKTLLRTNFQRKMLSLEILERIEKKYTGKAHKAPYLYRFQKTEDEDKFY